MSDMKQAEEQNKIKLIEGIMGELTGNVRLTLTKASEIDEFFFGSATAEKKPDGETPAAGGWFNAHIRVLRRLHDRVLDVCGALENLHQVVKK